ncbi:UNVERIFIED_CONTAM: hypothetical protein K2H54_009352 [Gekko kuhli]
MTRLDCSGYSLSHQLFYFMFAVMKGCSDPLFLGAPYYKQVFCASMKRINVDAERQARLHTFGDLFVENIGENRKVIMSPMAVLLSNRVNEAVPVRSLNSFQ